MGEMLDKIQGEGQCCGECIHLSMKECDQTENKEDHMCLKLNQRVVHGEPGGVHPRILRLCECVKNDLKEEPKYEGFCNACGFKVKSFEGLEKCPQCGTTGIPCSYDNQVNISINIQELRVLAVWAEQWASNAKDEKEQHQMAIVLRSIQKRINDQLQPLGKKIPMLSDEIQGLKDKFGDDNVETNMTRI